MTQTALSLLHRRNLARLTCGAVFGAVLTGCATTSPQPQPWLAVSELKLAWMTWGEVQEEWIVPAGGEARWSKPGVEEKAFPVTQAEFESVRDQFRGFEGIPFNCERVMTDAPTGRLVWSEQGQPVQTLDFDLGCVTGDADELFDKVDAAAVFLAELRDRGR